MLRCRTKRDGNDDDRGVVVADGGCMVRRGGIDIVVGSEAVVDGIRKTRKGLMNISWTRLKPLYPPMGMLSWQDT